MKSLLLVMTFLLLSFQPKVYVCVSSTSVAYHSREDCSGLNRCSHTIKPMTVGEAMEIGKRACKMCY